MKTKYRWLTATIEIATADKNNMSWLALENRRDWRRRCAIRAKKRT